MIIKITLRNGDCVELFLDSDKEALDVLKDGKDWINPKVYKGKSMDEEDS